MELRGNWHYPTSDPVRQRTRRRSSPTRAPSLGMKRPLLVTDRGLAALDIVATVACGHLAAGGLGEAVCLAGVDPNPTGANLEAGLARLPRRAATTASSRSAAARRWTWARRSRSCPGQTRPVWDFEDVDDWWTRADDDGIDPIVAVPTTAGTGSEVGRASVLTNETTHEKKIIFHPRLLPGHRHLRPRADAWGCRRG